MARRAQPREEVLAHATCVAFAGRAAVLRGESGSGKSDLALRFVSAFGGTGAKRAALVADDQVRVLRDGERLMVQPPGTIAGRLEVRGLGIVDMAHDAHAELVLLVDLTPAQEVPRLPPDPLPRERLLGVAMPVLRLDPGAPSAHVKLKLALTGRP